MTEGTSVQSLALLVGAVFLLAGIAGFVPGITSGYGELEFSGPDSGAKLLGIFQVSVLLNLVHVSTGIAGLALARSYDGARTFLVGGGVAYLVIWVYGLVAAEESAANFLPVDRADNWLHFSLALAMIVGGVLLTRSGPGAA